MISIIIIFLILISFVVYIIRYAIIEIIKSDRKNRELLATVTKPYRGTRSERDLVLKLLKNEIPQQTIFHDLYVRKRNGEYSQVDLVVATKVGIVVFEVKEYSGWIYGNGNQAQWTQVLAYGQTKHRLYNPILQNNGHITALKKQLKQFQNIPFYSVIVFYGNCALKEINDVPKGTLLVKSHQAMDAFFYIINNNEPAPYTNKREVVNILKEAVENGDNAEVQIQHVENIQQKTGRY